MGGRRRTTGARAAALLAHLEPPRRRLLRAVLDAAHRRGVAVHLVGGAVRDLLLGRAPKDLDLLLAGDVEPVAEAVAARLHGAEARVHRRFKTAVVEWPPGARVDLASCRAETYAEAAVLPEVRPAAMQEDLARRDFSINAMALEMTPAGPGRLTDPHGGRGDLARRRIRVLHPRSFMDDPTRALRGVRLAARLGFRLEAQTRRWMQQAVDAGILERVSAARLGAELRQIAGEPRPGPVLRAFLRHRLLGVLDPCVQRWTLAAARRLDRHLARLDTGARLDLLLAALVAVCHPSRRRAILQRVELPGGVRRRAHAAAAAAQRLRRAVTRGRSRDAAELVLACQRDGEVAARLAEALTDEPRARRRLRGARRRAAGVHLAISGADLLAAGVPPGPEVRRRLQATLRRRLAGGVPTRRQQLRFALSSSGREMS